MRISCSNFFENMLPMFLTSISILPPCITYSRNKILCNDMECELETGIIYTYFVLLWQEPNINNVNI